jgi:hypothetical protein
MGEYIIYLLYICSLFFFFLLAYHYAWHAFVCVCLFFFLAWKADHLRAQPGDQGLD